MNILVTARSIWRIMLVLNKIDCNNRSDKEDIFIMVLFMCQYYLYRLVVMSVEL